MTEIERLEKEIEDLKFDLRQAHLEDEMKKYREYERSNNYSCAAEVLKLFGEMEEDNF